MRIKSLVFAGGLVTLARFIEAQPTGFGQSGASRPIRVMVGGGATVPIGDFADAYDTGFNIAGSLLINFAGFPINLRTDINYSRLQLKDLVTSPGGTVTADDATKMLGGLINLTLPLGAGPIRPYIMAGLGAFNVDPADLSTTPAKSSVEFAINDGGGLQLRLFGLEVFVEARINNVYTDKGVIDQKGIQLLPVTFGVIF